MTFFDLVDDQQRHDVGSDIRAPTPLIDRFENEIARPERGCPARDFGRPPTVKRLGEIGVVGVAAAVANAVFHATGKRIRELPITID